MSFCSTIYFFLAYSFRI